MEEKKPQSRLNKPNQAQDAGKLTVTMDLPQKDLVQCPVCGHKNPPNVGLCEMCSCYLFVK